MICFLYTLDLVPPESYAIQSLLKCMKVSKAYDKFWLDKFWRRIPSRLGLWRLADDYMVRHLGPNPIFVPPCWCSATKKEHTVDSGGGQLKWYHSVCLLKPPTQQCIPLNLFQLYGWCGSKERKWVRRLQNAIPISAKDRSWGMPSLLGSNSHRTPAAMPSYHCFMYSSSSSEFWQCLGHTTASCDSRTLYCYCRAL